MAAAGGDDVAVVVVVLDDTSPTGKASVYAVKLSGCTSKNVPHRYSCYVQSIPIIGVVRH